MHKNTLFSLGFVEVNSLPRIGVLRGLFLASHLATHTHTHTHTLFKNTQQTCMNKMQTTITKEKFKNFYNIYIKITT